jgi:hypothetical protein
MATKTQYNKEELKKIINDEIKSFVKSELDNELKKIMSKTSSDSRKEMTNVVKDGLAKFAEFMFVRKGIWQNDIK